MVWSEVEVEVGAGVVGRGVIGYLPMDQYTVRKMNERDGK